MLSSLFTFRRLLVPSLAWLNIEPIMLEYVREKSLSIYETLFTIPSSLLVIIHCK